MNTTSKTIVSTKAAGRARKPRPLASLSTLYAIGYGMGWEYRALGGTDLRAALGSCSSDPAERAGFEAGFEDAEPAA